MWLRVCVNELLTNKRMGRTSFVYAKRLSRRHSLTDSASTLASSPLSPQASTASPRLTPSINPSATTIKTGATSMIEL